MVLAAFAQVVNRNIFKLGIGWFEELAVYCMIWMTLLGAEMGLRDGSQVSIAAVVEKLPSKARALMRIITKLIVTVFSAAITRSAVGMVLKQIETGQTSAGLKVSMAVPYSALLAGFGIATLVQGISVVFMIIHFFKGERGIEA